MSDVSDSISAKLAENGVAPEPPPPVSVVEKGDDLPFVEHKPQLSSMARDLANILCNNGLFVRQRAPLTVSKDGRFVEMTPKRFITYVEQSSVPFEWVMPKPNQFEKKPKSLSLHQAGTILESDDFLDRQREVNRIATVRQPVLRKDGRLELLPYGYDAESKTVTVEQGVEFAEDVPLEDARNQIRALLREFPFGDRKACGTSRNEAVVVAGMLSMFCSPMLRPDSRRVNFIFSSNSVGSGKTLLAQICVTVTIGACDVQPVPESKEDWRKILDTEALAGSSYILFDDINGFFKSQILNAFLTAPTWSGRRMNTQTRFTVPKMATVFLTGNNLEVSPDIARRFLHCKMVVEDADPQARKIERFFSDGHFERIEVRRQVLAALWAIVREWDKAGRPCGSRTIRGYESWANMFGGMVEFAGFGDALEPLAVEESGNSELADMTVLVDELSKDVDGRAEVTFSQIVDVARDHNCFTWMLEGKESSDGRFVLTAKAASRFGKMLSEQYGGKRFDLSDGRSVRWDRRGKKRGRQYVIEVIS